MKESSELILKITMAGPGGRKQTLIPGRAELLLVICYLLCNLSELLTLSETVCYMHRTDTLQLLRVSSEAVHHAQAFSTAEPKHKLSSPLPAGGGGVPAHSQQHCEPSLSKKRREAASLEIWVRRILISPVPYLLRSMDL